jgi:hypothetical protein
MLFTIGKRYTRPEVYWKLTGKSVQRTKGAWNKGWVQHENMVLIFANVGVPGQGGYDYPNKWVHSRLIWETTPQAAQHHKNVTPLFDSAIDVHVFSRSDNKAPWTYAGIGYPADVSGNKPVYVTWTFSAPPSPPPAPPVPRPAWNTYRTANPAHSDRQTANVVILSRDPAQLERALMAHADIQNGLATLLIASGHTPLSPGSGPDFDLAWEKDGSIHVVEVKSITDLNETHQIRLGIGQLAGYRGALQADGRTVGRCILALEACPSSQLWHIATSACGIELIFAPSFSGFL